MDKSLLSIGLKGKFEDAAAEIIGRIIYVDSDGSRWNQWHLKTLTDDHFWLREYEEDGEILYELLTRLETDKDETSEEIAHSIFRDWKNIEQMAIRNKVKVKSIKGIIPEGLDEGHYVKMADLSFCNAEEGDDCDEDEVTLDIALEWDSNGVRAFGLEYLDEEEVIEIFEL